MSEQEKNSESSARTSGEKEPAAGNDVASLPLLEALEQQGLLPKMKHSGVSRESLLGLYRVPGDDGL